MQPPHDPSPARQRSNEYGSSPSAGYDPEDIYDDDYASHEYQVVAAPKYRRDLRVKATMPSISPTTRPTFIAGLVAVVIVVSLVSGVVGAIIAVRYIVDPPLQQQQAFGRVIAIDYPLNALNHNLAADNCTNILLTAQCESDLSTLARDDGRFIADLKALKVPTCLSTTNTLFLQGLSQEQSGATALEQAVKNNDVNAVAVAAKSAQQGADVIDRAMTAYKSAMC